MESVGGVRDGDCGRGQGWRVWEGPGMEGVGGARNGGCGRGQDGVEGCGVGGCGRGQGWRVLEGTGLEGVGGDRVGGCGRGQGWRVWEGMSSLYKAINFPHFIFYVCTLFARIHSVVAAV